MSVRVVAPNGVLREFWDDSLRTYTTWDAAGVQTSTRAYTPIENARADAEAAASTTSGNGSTITDRILTVDMPAMQALLDATNATINAGPAPYLKDIARAVRRLDRKVANLLDGTA